MGTVALRFLFGGIAGILSWMLCEPAAPKVFNSPNWGDWERTFILVLGALIGLAIGGLNGFQVGGTRHTVRGAVMGVVFGAIGAMLGHQIGAGLVAATFGPSVFMQTDAAHRPVMIFARMLAAAPMGLCLGAAIGGSSLTMKRTIQGGIGGLVGAAAAGAVFDLVGSMIGPTLAHLDNQKIAEVGGPSRAIFALATGAMIGLFIGLVDRLARSAWLRLSLGRNEGKEWSIDAAQTFIGRSEGANVPLFGDPNVAPLHASIVKQGGGYVLLDGGSAIGTLLNGQRIQSAPLMSGSQIQIGGFVLQFLMKNSAAPVRGPEAYVGQAYPIGGQQAQYPRQPQQPAGVPGAPTQAMPMQGVQTQAFPHQGMPQQGMPTQAYPGPTSQPTTAYAAPLQPAAAAGGFVLVAVDGPLMGNKYPVRASMDVGREAPSIPMGFDTNASRRHANVGPAFSGVTVTDLGSTNGTFVNGNRIQSAQANPGDMVKIGSTTFRVEAL